MIQTEEIKMLGGSYNKVLLLNVSTELKLKGKVIVPNMFEEDLCKAGHTAF